MTRGRPCLPPGAAGQVADPVRRRWWRRLAAGAMAASAVGPGAWAGTALPPLRRGFNLAHWFEYERTQAVTGDELRTMARLGLDHVRIPLDPLACGWQLARPEQLPFLADLAQAVDQVQAAGLATVIDLHLRPDHKAAVERDTTLEPVVAALWSRLARRFAALPTTAVAFELFNEPQYYGLQGWRWPGLQRRLLAAVRAEAPQHRVLLSGHRGGGIDGLLALAPEADAGAAYTFHFYDPFVFTHQALPWLDDRHTAAGTRRDVLYPARLHRQAAPTLLRPHPKAAQEWADYLAHDWGPQAVRQQIDRVGAWARRHRVAALCTEFGAIRAHAEAGSRYRWLADVRQACEANGLGWTVWDYTHIFGLTAQSAQVGQAVRRVLDAAAPAALGLAALAGG
jgi:endoglucanase